MKELRLSDFVTNTLGDMSSTHRQIQVSNDTLKYIILHLDMSNYDLHYETKHFHNQAFESSKDLPWLNYVHIGLELVSPKNIHVSTFCTLNSSISSPMKYYRNTYR